MSERVEYDGYVGGNVVSWLRYEYEGLNLLRIDERYDDDDPANGIDSGDPWRPLNVFVHAPGSIGQIVRAKWFNYRDCTTTPCDSGYYYYFYDALGNVAGVYDENTDQFIDYEMDAFGNDLPGGNSFLAMDQCGPKEHLTGKMYDTDTGLYYFSARWYDPEVGRFVGSDKSLSVLYYTFCYSSPSQFYDPDGRKPRESKIGGATVINAPPGLGPKGSNVGGDKCNCDPKLLNKYFFYWEAWYSYYTANDKDTKDDIEKNIPDHPEDGLPSPTAELYCDDDRLEDKRVIEFYGYSRDTCVNQCILEHELTHFSQRDSLCRITKNKYKDVNVREAEAYCQTLKCLNRMFERLGYHKRRLPGGCN